jgi:hypothetical protein
MVIVKLLSYFSLALLHPAGCYSSYKIGKTLGQTFDPESNLAQYESSFRSLYNEIK